MARPRKVVSLEEKLEKVNAEIADCNEKLSELQDEKQDIEKQIRDRDIGELLDVVKSSGKSIAELKEMLAN